MNAHPEIWTIGRSAEAENANEDINQAITPTITQALVQC